MVANWRAPLTWEGGGSPACGPWRTSWGFVFRKQKNQKQKRLESGSLAGGWWRLGGRAPHPASNTATNATQTTSTPPKSCSWDTHSGARRRQLASRSQCKICTPDTHSQRRRQHSASLPQRIPCTDTPCRQGTEHLLVPCIPHTPFERTEANKSLPW